jgi:hypothetical protein
VAIEQQLSVVRAPRARSCLALAPPRGRCGAWPVG